jgi:hypothetical protein
MGPPPAACTDAERRLANELHDRLRAAGHEAWVETVWVRPRWAWSIALHCALAAIGGLVAIGAPVPGLVVAALGALGLAAEALGRPGPLRLLMRRRATQNVLVEPRPGHTPILLVAPYDARPTGRAARLLPTLRPWLALCGFAAAACAAARVAGQEGGALGAAQLVPTVALLLGGALAAEAALASPSAEGQDVDAAIALLGRHPAGLVLYGGGSPAALRAHVRGEKPKPIVVEAGDAERILANLQ